MALPQRKQQDIQPASQTNRTRPDVRSSDRDNARRSRRAADRRTSNVQIKEQKPAAADSNYPTVSDNFSNTQTGRTTAAQLRKQTEESREEWKQHQAYIAEQERRERVKSPGQKKKEPKYAAKRRGSLNGVAKAVRPTFKAATSVFNVCLIQLVGTFVLLIGYGIEAGIANGGDSLWKQLLGWFAKQTVDGESLIAAGLVISMICGFVAWGMTAGIYIMSGAKPFRGKGMSGALVSFVFMFIPFSIYIWILLIFLESTSKKSV